MSTCFKGWPDKQSLPAHLYSRVLKFSFFHDLSAKILAFLSSSCSLFLTALQNEARHADLEESFGRLSKTNEVRLGALGQGQPWGFEFYIPGEVIIFSEDKK